MLTWLAYAADAAILAAYAAAARGRPVRWFHWANAVGCAPIIAVEVGARAWPPLVLTAAFGAVGWVGVAERSGPDRRRGYRRSGPHRVRPVHAAGDAPPESYAEHRDGKQDVNVTPSVYRA